MADITLRSPLTDFRRLLDEWREDDGRVWRWMSTLNGFTDGLLPVDVVEDDGRYVVRASLPGFARDEVTVQVGNGVLNISAERTEEREEHGDHFVRRERYSGSMSRQVALVGVTADSQVDAVLKDGVLSVTVAAAAAKTAKRVEIRDGNDRHPA